MDISNKIGFLALFALVISSQIGSGIFMLPISLAPYGLFSLTSWMISSIAAISLALIFALLCSKFPETGGPHIYIERAFGSTLAFFAGWTYWVISWVSTTAVVVTSIGYLSQGDLHLLFEILLLTIVTLINLRGVTTAGFIEFLLTTIKVIALLIIPIVALFYFDKNNFVISKEVSDLTISQILAHSTLLTLWCFTGLESVTATAGSVKNPTKNIPRAIVFGTICVAIIYFINSLAIMGLINGNTLVSSKAPYVDVAKIIFPGNWYGIVSIIAFIVCVASLNAWILASGQVALGLAESKFMPRLFAKKNKYDSPYWSIIISSLGTGIFLILTSSSNFAKQINLIIDFSVISFLFIYLVSGIAFLKFAIQEKHYFQCVIGIIVVAFCSWVIYETTISVLLVASLFTISGIPIYCYLLRRQCFKKRVKMYG